MHRPRLSKAAASASADAVTAGLSGGTLRLYDGTQPKTPDTPVTQVELAELTFGFPAFQPAVDGVALANTITADASANGGGKATWYRAFTPGGTAVFDGSVGTADADLLLPQTMILPGVKVAVDQFHYTQPRKD